MITTIIILAIFSFMNLAGKDNFNPPKAKQEEVTDNKFGFSFTDYYRWLENKDDPEVRSWSEKQNKYTVDFINKNYKEIPGLKEEISQLIDRDYRGAPFFKGDREFFYAKKKGDHQSKIFTRIKSKEILIFDPEKLDKSGKTSITAFVPTKDGNRAAVGFQTKGTEISNFVVIDTKTGAIINDNLKDIWNFSWARDENYAYITFRSKEMIEKQLPLKTFLHKIGDDHKNDKFLVAPDDAKNSASVWDEEFEPVTFYSIGDFYSNALKIKKTGSDEEPVTIYSSNEFSARPFSRFGKIFIFTNHKAPNFKLMVTDINKPDFSNWKDLIPEKETVMESYIITNDYIILMDKKDVISRLSVYNLNGGFVKELELPEISDVGGMSYHTESNTVFVSFNSFTAPSKQYKLDGKTLKWEFFYQDSIPINTQDIETKLVFFSSKDGTKIPLFIVHKKGLKQDGNNPVILNGYGGFNVGMSPSFLGVYLSFINRGGVYALACLRGGNEYGEKWHQAGMLHNKQNVFDDFISAAEYLINENYTNPAKLGIRGGSNGGLLIGAVLTQRPDLFKAAICGVPLLDMLRYHKFLIARYWIPEYGDPDKEEDFKYILRYSPYHNIKLGVNLPATLIKAGENDSRVDPLHAKKFAAALQNNPWQKNPIFLFVDFESGHGSGQSVEQQIKNTELEWKFIMNELGL